MRSTILALSRLFAVAVVSCQWSAVVQAQPLELPRGILITDVVPVSTAAQAGISRGDIITQVNSRRVINGFEFVERLRESNGQATLAIFDRSAKQFRTAMVRPDRNGLIGVYGVPTDRMVNHRASMVIVNAVSPNSVAHLAGLIPGSVILSVNGMRVRTNAEYSAAFTFSGPVAHLSFVSAIDGLVHDVTVPSDPLGRIGAFLVTVPWL